MFFPLFGLAASPSVTEYESKFGLDWFYQNDSVKGGSS